LAAICDEAKADEAIELFVGALKRDDCCSILFALPANQEE
jgi:hypothetical protein